MHIVLIQQLEILINLFRTYFEYIKLYNGKNITNTDNILHNCTDLYLLNSNKQKNYKKIQQDIKYFTRFKEIFRQYYY